MAAVTGIPVNAGALQQVTAHQQVPQQQQPVQHVPQQVQQVPQTAGMQPAQAQPAAAGGVPTGWWQYM